MASTDSHGPNLRRVSILARWMLGGWNALEAPASDQITSYEVRLRLALRLLLVTALKLTVLCSPISAGHMVVTVVDSLSGEPVEGVEVRQLPRGSQNAGAPSVVGKRVPCTPTLLTSGWCYRVCSSGENTGRGDG